LGVALGDPPGQYGNRRNNRFWPHLAWQPAPPPPPPPDTNRFQKKTPVFVCSIMFTLGRSQRPDLVTYRPRPFPFVPPIPKKIPIGCRFDADGATTSSSEPGGPQSNWPQNGGSNWNINRRPPVRPPTERVSIPPAELPCEWQPQRPCWTNDVAGEGGSLNAESPLRASPANANRQRLKKQPTWPFLQPRAPFAALRRQIAALLTYYPLQHGVEHVRWSHAGEDWNTPPSPHT